MSKTIAPELFMMHGKHQEPFKKNQGVNKNAPQKTQGMLNNAQPRFFEQLPPIPNEDSKRTLLARYDSLKLARDNFLKQTGRDSIDPPSNYGFQLGSHGEVAHALWHCFCGGSISSSKSESGFNLENSGLLELSEIFRNLGKKIRTEIQFSLASQKKIKPIPAGDAHLSQIPENYASYLWLLKLQEQIPLLIKEHYPNAYVDRLESISDANKYRLEDGAICIWLRSVEGNERGDREEKINLMHQMLKGIRQVQELSSVKSLLFLGDKNDSTSTFINNMKLTKHWTLIDHRGSHIALSQIDQILYFIAMMENYKIKLVLGERSGLIDKIGLVSGVMNVQVDVNGSRDRTINRLKFVHNLAPAMGLFIISDGQKNIQHNVALLIKEEYHQRDCIKKELVRLNKKPASINNDENNSSLSLGKF